MQSTNSMFKRCFLGFLTLFVAGIFVLPGAAQNASVNPTPTAKPTPYLTPEEELKTFTMPEGYKMELVVSDPDIKEPTVAVFDGNGKMYVGEMRTYMQNIDGVGEHEHTSRISLHWSSKGDGVFDKIGR